MKVYASFSKIDEEARMVYGYASTEAVDSHGEIVSREALRSALPDFMRFANIREMHQPSAVGRAADAEIDDKGLYLSAHIVDEAAWAKVKTGVYNGFSIAGQVTARDPVDRKLITGCTLSEISLVDRPANPEAVFDLYKADPIGKTGARNSAEDLARVQTIHDRARDLGAVCGGERVEKSAIAPELLTRLSAQLDDLAERIKTLERRPAPPKGALRAIAKSDDLGAPHLMATGESTHSLIKAALRVPRQF